MAIVSMADAVLGSPASSAEYNKLIDNIEDLDARLGAVTSGASANTRLMSLESLTTNTSGVVGIGNQRLSDRLGAGVTTANTAAAQLTTLENRTTHVSTGNAALGTRVAALEAATTTPPFFHGYSSAGQAVSSAAYTPIALSQETVDNANGHSGVTNNSRYTPGTLGWYECYGVIMYQEGPAAYAANQIGGRIQKNGAAVPAGPLGGSFPTPDTATNILSSVYVFAMVQITVNTDYIEIAGVSSYATNTVAGTFLRCRWVSA